MWPLAVITGRALPAGIEEIVSVTADGPLVIYDRALSTAECRFAIAHAIAHLIFDVDARLRKGVVIEPMRELRADDFARELLVPDRALIRHIALWPSDGDDFDTYMDQVDMVAATFHVPPAIIDQRIRVLERRAILQRKIALTV